MRHLQHMRWALLLSALIASPALAAPNDGWHRGADCETTALTGSVTVATGQKASWCPITSTTGRISVGAIADCNWNADTSGTGAGSVTLTATKCGGSTTAANSCKNLLTDGTGNSTITSGDPTGFFSLDSGDWLITASGTAANGMLVCTGRD